MHYNSGRLQALKKIVREEKAPSEVDIYLANDALVYPLMDLWVLIHIPSQWTENDAYKKYLL